jgi:hypothetical protein
LVILGTEYAGEMKKGSFTVANCFALKRGILSIRTTHYDRNSPFKAWPKRLERGNRFTGKRHPIHDPRYKSLPEGDLPCTECFKGTVTRFLPYWSELLAPSLRAGLRPIIAAHADTLRSLVKYVDGISGADIPELEIPTGNTSRPRTDSTSLAMARLPASLSAEVPSRDLPPSFLAPNKAVDRANDL